MRKSLLASAVALAMLPLAAPAQSIDNHTATELDVVVVTATRSAEDPLLVPAAVDVVSADEIHRAQPELDLSESLQRVPGVVARDRQNRAQDLQVSIRGYGARATFGVRGVRLYTDGIPATMPDGQGQVSHFPLESAGRIEVLRGPFSALYGNASGGVIELFTAGAPPEPTLRAGYTAGSYGLSKASLSFHTPWGEARDGDLLVDIADTDSDGYRDHSASHTTSGQALMRGGFGNGGRYTLLFNGIDIEADDPQGLTAEQVRTDRRAASDGALTYDNRKTVRQDQAGARIEYPLSAAHSVTVTAWAGNRKTTQMLSIPAFVQQSNPLHNGGAIDLDRDYHGIDGRWRWETDLAGQPFSLTAGIDHEVSDEHRLGFENYIGDQLGVVGALRRDEYNQVTGSDIYVQADWAPTERWRVNLGVRRSEIEFQSDDRFITDINPDDSGRLEYSRTSPVLGVLFRATGWLSLYANAGSGFETPTFSELAYRSDGQGGLNDTLDPARSRNVEAGLRADRGDWRYSAALFHSRTEDELIVALNEGGRSIYDNAGTTRRRGAEFSIEGEFAPGWHVAGAYTFLDARYVDDFAVCGDPPCAAGDVVIEGGRYIPGLSRHTAFAELRWSPVESSDVMLQGRFVDRVYTDDANSEFAPAYASVDLAAEHRFAALGLDWSGFARINNLLDRDIIGSVIVNSGGGRWFEPAPGRHWVVGLSAARSFD